MVSPDDCKAPRHALHNLNINTPRGTGTPKSSPMHLCQLAIKSNDAIKVVSHVHSFGVNMLGKNGFQALHFAACYGRSEIAAYLLHPLGADVNSQTARGNTPLHIACFETMIPMIELLVHHGADPSVINWQKKNPVDMAQRPRTLQVLTRTLQARSGGFLTNPSRKLYLHYYQFFGLNVGATQNEICSAFKEVLRSIFLKRGVSDETRHVDLQEACEAFLVLRRFLLKVFDYKHFCCIFPFFAAATIAPFSCLGETLTRLFAISAAATIAAFSSVAPRQKP